MFTADVEQQHNHNNKLRKVSLYFDKPVLVVKQLEILPG